MAYRKNVENKYLMSYDREDLKKIPRLTARESAVSMKSAKALPRYGSGHKSSGRTDGRTDGRTERRTDGQRQNNIPPPMAGDNKPMQLPRWRSGPDVLKFHG
ncbi:hypothetical protein DPMN_174931 [Dreissena polymorpha]|uniref:Uncharacterized protein n=1 Tax=Dreissena polymorpha TaxID=45954 RepID=A0A9D4IHL4_DREPO|nr:hypothetical protein DPMN_174931 [Dreissena polymorpha]